MEQKINKFIYWTPRILSILFICFLALFSLDIFDLKLGFWETLLGLLIHNIPSLILLVVLLISWKHGLVGGIIFILAGIFYMLIGELPYSLIIAGPAFLIGILFTINWLSIT